MGSLNRVLQLGGGGGGGGAAEFEFSGGVDQGFGGEHQFGANFIPNFPNSNRSNTILYPSNNLGPISLHNQNTTTTTTTTTTFDSSPEIKPPFFNLINQHQTHNPQNPSFFLPLSYGQQQEQSLFVPPQAKRHNPGGGGCEISATKGSFSENDSFNPARQQQQFLPNQLQFLPHYLQQRPKTGVGDEMGSIIDQIQKASELIVQTGNNPVLAQGILARLNHQLSPIGKPFQRAAFYCKESLQLLLQTNNNNNLNNPSITSSTPFSLIFKIGAFKSYSEISPLIPFANFTCNQAILEVLEGFDRIHVLDFDIGYGGQWASLMQELSLRSGGAPSLKITALASPSTHDPIELGLTRENLIQFASDVNISFEFDVMNVDSLNSCSWSLPFQPSENEAIAVNLPIGCLSNYQVSLPLVLRFVKQLSPRIVVSIDKGCDRNDLPFANHVVHALHSYTNLLESLDAVNVNMDALQKIERFMVQPAIEKIVMGRFRFPEKSQHWRTLFMSCGFTPITFSNFTESQAECVVKRTPVRGFQVEKRQSSLVLCWQRKELISVSAWRC
ncbi:hypothetical protein ACJIZ3_016222 [Penstemon smallii]|uniref:Uncharacterized protein n=1 Tax=Penstemon smallii TaxID=265156 RepID=A0ABD3RPS0_9LAMI